MGGRTTLEHKKYGTLGSEFIVHHCMYKPRRLVLSLLFTSTLATAIQIHETDIVVLWIMSGCLGLLLLYRLLYKVRKETLLVMPSLGVEVKTQYWLGSLETHFFDKAHVRGIIINEAITMHSVLSYLAVLLRAGSTGPTQHIFPLFTRSWPGQQDLVYIYQAVENMHLGQPPTLPLPHSHQDGVKGGKHEGIGEIMPPTQADGMEGEEQPVVRRSSRRSRKS
ncbi:phosphatidylinositol N-acetylglucosaminyltransferase subunit H-like [Babylonia areolata]|uniref:phosphatidylinositol N-acetylglucosaminyltransferase subunit H-like n=1 Tax=Babylonia areolata TaxID=304850 RepID=UPI003FD034B6